MVSTPDSSASAEESGGNLFALGLISLIAGAAAGFVGALFRLLLARGDALRNTLVDWAHGQAGLGFAALVGACVAATVIAAWMVRKFAPVASGSGVPHVEAVLKQELPPAPLLLTPVKFVGGLLSIGAGLALGREGPSVQMGASIAHEIGRLFRFNFADCRVLLAAGAGAGLATAFNAPIAGAVFVLEELLRRFDTRTTIATFGASAGAIAISRLFVGDSSVFHVPVLAFPNFGTLPLFLALGLVVGLLGVAYNKTLLGVLWIGRGSSNVLTVEVRAATVGAIVGVIAWFAPTLVGGGNPLTQNALDASRATATLGWVLLIRFALGAVSYAARTPGGLFAPLLVLGAQAGLICGSITERFLPKWAPHPSAFAIVGMAAFFTAVVRAPVTGIILVTEMTGNVTLLLPMLGACFVAMLVPTILNDEPIYDSLRRTTVREHAR